MPRRVGVGVRAPVGATYDVPTPRRAATPIDAGLPARTAARIVVAVPQGRPIGEGLLQIAPVAAPAGVRQSTLLVLLRLPSAALQGSTALGHPAPVPGGPIRPTAGETTSRRRRHVAGAVAAARAPRGVPARHETRPGLELRAAPPRVSARLPS